MSRWHASWQDLLVCYRRLEFTGEIRGGRFEQLGEQFPGCRQRWNLRAMKSARVALHQQEMTLSAADPLNLAGVIPYRVRSGSGRRCRRILLVFRDGWWCAR